MKSILLCFISITLLSISLKAQDNLADRPESIEYQLDTIIYFTLDDSYYDCYMLGTTDSGESVSIIMLRSDGFKGSIFHKGDKTRQYDGFGGISISNKDILAFRAIKKGKKYWVVNDKEYGPYNEIRYPLEFSRDGSRFMFFGLKQTTYSQSVEIIIDGKKKKYDMILSTGQNVFSNDSKNSAYAARNGNNYFLVINGKKSKNYELTGVGPIFSEFGDKVAFSGYRNDTAYIVINFEEYGGYTSVKYIVFSPNGEHFAAVVKLNFDYHLVIDSGLSQSYEGVWDPVFSKHGNHFAYAAQRDSSIFIVMDSIEQEKFSDVGPVFFSPDEKRFAYTAFLSIDSMNPRQMMVIDGEHQTEFKIIYPYSILYSNDSKHIAYKADKDTSVSGVVVVLDNIVGKEYSYIRGLLFSPDSRELSYAAIIEDSSECVVRNGIEGSRFKHISDFVYSCDGKHIAYIGSKNNQEHLVIDDYISPGFYRIKPSIPVFRQDNSITFFAAKDERIIYKINVKPNLKSIPIDQE